MFNLIRSGHRERNGEIADTVHPARAPVECRNVRDCQGFVLFNSIQSGDFLVADVTLFSHKIGKLATSTQVSGKRVTRTW